MSGTRKERDGVLVLTMLYRPEPNFITADVAERLRAHEPVTVITAHPNYPLGRFYDEVRRPWLPRRSVEGGVTVWRVPHFPDHGSSRLLRLLSYLSFTLVAALCAPFLCPRPRLVWVYQTPFTVGLAALWFRARGARIAYTAADLWPETLETAGRIRPELLRRIVFAFSRWINRPADLIICATRGMAERYARDGVPRERLLYLPVWVDGTPRGELRPPVGSKNSLSVVYAGNIGPAQELGTLVRAAAKLHRRGAPVTFDLYGTGRSEDELRALAAELGAENVRFHGRVTPEEAFQRSSEALAQVVSLRATPLFATSIPSKLPFSFAVGTPVLYGLVGEAAALAAESGGAIAFDVERPETLVQAVERLLATPAEERRAMGVRLQEYFREHFDPGVLLDAYDAALRAPGPRSGAAMRDA